METLTRNSILTRKAHRKRNSKISLFLCKVDPNFLPNFIYHDRHFLMENNLMREIAAEAEASDMCDGPSAQVGVRTNYFDPVLVWEREDRWKSLTGTFRFLLP